MAKICFVTYEIHPLTAGGCGVLLYNAAQVLISQGHEVIIVLDAKPWQFKRFDPQVYPDPQACRAYLVDELCRDLPLKPGDFPTAIQHRVYRFHWAARKVYEKEKPDVIEFFDYNGSAHYACAAKVAWGDYAHSRLVIRLHNSDQLMNAHQPLFELNHEFYTIYALEKSALKLAETVLYPSQGYLDHCYRPHPENWLGQKVLSRPPLLDHPRPACESSDRDIVLFYGRLFGFKGVDLFVDAAVSLLSRGEMDGARFVLVGYDSRRPPDLSGDYRQYLLKRVPAALRERFEFPGHMSWEQLGELLPRVACAVIPSYLESFCYAAQELYEAGVPLLVSDIPVFADYFSHERNALVFDGTASHLAQSLQRLWSDPDLRQSLCRPYCVTENPLGDFYPGPYAPSWLNLRRDAPLSGEVLAVVLDDGREGLDDTLADLAAQQGVTPRVVVLRDLNGDEGAEAGALNFLGRLRLARDAGGKPLNAGNIFSGDYLLVLRAGDRARESFLESALGVLCRQPQLSWVSAWKWLRGPLGQSLDTYPLDACLELIPWSGRSLFSRAVSRTPAGRLLGDLLDPRLMEMGEVGHLWRLDSASGPGLVLPRALLSLTRRPAPKVNPRLLSYLVMSDEDPERKRRLSTFLVARDQPRPGPGPAVHEARHIRTADAPTALALGRELWGPILYDFCFRLNADLAREPRGETLLLHMPRRGLRLGYLFELFLRVTGRDLPCALGRVALSGPELAGACLERAPRAAAVLLLDQIPGGTLRETAAALLSLPPDAPELTQADPALDRPAEADSLAAWLAGKGALAQALLAWGGEQAARLDRSLLASGIMPQRVILLHPRPLTSLAELLAACALGIQWSCRHLEQPEPAGRTPDPATVLAGPLAVPDALLAALARDQAARDTGPWPPPPGRTHLGPGPDEPVLVGITAFFREADPSLDASSIAQRADEARRALAKRLEFPRLEEVEFLAGWQRPGEWGRPVVFPPEPGLGPAGKWRRVREAGWPQGQAALEFPRFRWLLQSLSKLLRIP